MRPRGGIWQRRKSVQIETHHTSRVEQPSRRPEVCTNPPCGKKTKARNRKKQNPKNPALPKLLEMQQRIVRNSPGSFTEILQRMRYVGCA